MSKSNYEIYAEKKQKATLSSTCTLEQAISLLKSKKEYCSYTYYEASCEMVAILFNLSYNEVNHAVEGMEHWIV